MYYKEDWDKVKERLTALWNNEIIDRCCVAVPAPKQNDPNRKKTPLPTEYKELVRYFTDPEWLLQRSIDRFERTYFGGDALPIHWINFGTAGHAKYFNRCQYQFSPQTVWYQQSLFDWEKDALEFDPENQVLKQENAAMKFLSDAGEGKFFVSMPDNCGNLDALEHLRGSNDLIYDLIDYPEKVKEACEKITEVLKIASAQQFAIIQKNNDGGSVHGWMNTWSTGRHLQLQCDFSVMISPAFYEEFVLPELESMSSWLDNAIYHFDGQEQINHLDMILSVKGIHMIQWTPVAGQPLTSAFIPVLQKIQKAGKGLVLFPQVQEVEKLMTNLSSRGLILNINGAKDQEEAKEIVEKVAKWTHE